MSHNPEPRVPIVGIGASAGGIEALEHFFRAVPQSIGAVFAVITHLNPERESVLASILQRWTDMPVEVIEDGMVAEPDHLYVMPENATLQIEGGCFQMNRPRPARREHKPIDLSSARSRWTWATGRSP